MTGAAAPWTRSLARTYAAWERFAAGEEHPEDVPWGIAASWHRCRDVYRIDPRGVPGTADDDEVADGTPHATLFAELGGLAASLGARHGDCLVTVTDGRGRVLTSWGSGPSGRRARDTGLASSPRWAETTAGTNAVGTALVSRHAAGVCGPQHWSSALHDWSCTAVALCDAGSAAPLATLTASTWRAMVPVRPVDLLVETRPLGGVLRAAAGRDRARVLAAYARIERRGAGALVALDAAGRVVAANAAFRARARREDGEVVGQLARCVRDGVTGTDDGAYELVPVLAGGEPVGFVVTVPEEPEFAAAPVSPVGPAPGPARLPALTATGRIVLLPVAAIRHARADGHTVWLTTDDGVLRAARRGIDHVERDLAGAGFLRVHRSHLVNLARVREVSAERGGLVLSTAPRGHERIPVSRRCAPRLRRACGM
jgi:sigma-54 dependent transcriptional regulator, acetoin dehydrogenase operon transcriptional activator AcoR